MFKDYKKFISFLNILNLKKRYVKVCNEGIPTLLVQIHYNYGHISTKEVAKTSQQL